MPGFGLFWALFRAFSKLKIILVQCGFFCRGRFPVIKNPSPPIFARRKNFFRQMFFCGKFFFSRKFSIFHNFFLGAEMKIIARPRNSGTRPERLRTPPKILRPNLKNSDALKIFKDETLNFRNASPEILSSGNRGFYFCAALPNIPLVRILDL